MQNEKIKNLNNEAAILVNQYQKQNSKSFIK